MLWLAAALVASVSGVSVTPIQKVLSMMEGMKATAIAAKKEEEVNFSAFTQFCTDTRADKEKAIAEENANIEKFQADIAKATSDIEELTADLAELDEDLARWKTDKKAATDVREKERVDYEATHRDYSDTVDAIERSLVVLKTMPQKLAQAEFVQSMEKVSKSPVTPIKARTALLALLATVQNPNVGLDYQAPEAYGYETQTGGIQKMLEELRVRFVTEKTDLEKEEMNNRNAYQMMMQRLTDQCELAEQEHSTKTKQRAQRKADLAEAEGELAEEQTLLNNDEKYLADLNTMCHSKSDEFEARQTLRAEEIKALSQAIDIIGSQAVKGAGEEHLPSFTQQDAGVALAQLRSSTSPNLQRVASFLAERAKKLHSATLAMIAQKAKDDPFTKVKKMIRDLITKLLEEAASEADHKAFCDAELATNKQTRQNKAEAVEELTAEVEKQTAISAKLAGEMADLQEEISDIDKAMVTATSERQEEKEKNAATVKDAAEAQTAVAEALAVLREFYAKAAQATAFVQQSPAEDAPTTWGSTYTGMGAESGGVIGMLEVIESDFSRLQTETEAAEEQAAAEYKKFMNDSKQDKAVKETEMEHKQNKRTTVEELLVSTKRSLEQTQTELDAALKYYDKLKPDCVDSGITYEERVKRRKEELESLQDAYKILAGEDLPSLTDMKAEQIEP
jgi:chromosome segregation ATPase